MNIPIVDTDVVSVAKEAYNKGFRIRFLVDDGRYGCIFIVAYNTHSDKWVSANENNLDSIPVFIFGEVIKDVDILTMTLAWEVVTILEEFTKLGLE